MQLAHRSLSFFEHNLPMAGLQVNCHKRNGNNQATAAACQALIFLPARRCSITSKMPNSRKKSREFGMACFVAKPGVEMLNPNHCWFG
jgi:hypothetical protein